MDNSDRSNNRSLDYLGVNKLGKNIKKSPIHQPNLNNANTARQQSQPQVYNINKNDFRSIVQQLTGSPSPSQEPPQPRPPHNPSKPPSMRLQKIRPPPLAPINRPRIPMHPAPMPAPDQVYNNNFARPPHHHHPQYGQPSPPPMLPPPFTPGDVWANTAESPISAYMRYLQNSIIDPGTKQMQTQTQPQGPVHTQAHLPSSGLLPNPSMPPLPSPRMNGPPPLLPSPRTNGPPSLPSPRMNGPHPPFLSPRMNCPPPPPLPSPGINGPTFLPSPTSQFLLQSPSGFFNLLSPRSPYPLLSPGPGMQHPPPLTPNFSFSHMAQPGIFGPGPQFPPSPGYGFPLSPSGFFPLTSPRWRDQ